MSTLVGSSWGGVAMSAIALVGGLAALLPQPVLDRVLLPIVGLAAGSLLGGAPSSTCFQAIDALGNNLAVYVWVVAGFVSFLPRRAGAALAPPPLQTRRTAPAARLPVARRRRSCNLVGGLAVGSAFVVDIRVGVVTWLVPWRTKSPRNWATLACSSRGLDEAIRPVVEGSPVVRGSFGGGSAGEVGPVAAQ